MGDNSIPRMQLDSTVLTANANSLQLQEAIGHRGNGPHPATLEQRFPHSPGLLPEPPAGPGSPPQEGARTSCW